MFDGVDVGSNFSFSFLNGRSLLELCTFIFPSRRALQALQITNFGTDITSITNYKFWDGHYKFRDGHYKIGGRA
jgi:hypothetical protein